ncbi:hypothetical protein R1sor_021230 [Riccia sorocarpa]|uniref:Uncharacterized protein n=1 Tax=Riccia sorocarpa TaxID=122646 RepID=A0ABD3GM64_9MARC
MERTVIEDPQDPLNRPDYGAAPRMKPSKSISEQDEQISWKQNQISSPLGLKQALRNFVVGTLASDETDAGGRNEWKGTEDRGALDQAGQGEGQGEGQSEEKRE